MPRLCDYLTVAQASEVLGVSKDTLRRWDRAGRLEARRHPVTGYRLYLKAELDNFLRRLSDGAASASRPGRAKNTKRKARR